MSRTRFPIPEELLEGRRRLDAWRRRRATRAMPGALWALAGDLGRRHGVSPTARALGLRYDVLKRHVLEGGRSARAPRPTFVEVSRPSASPCRVELEDGRGGRLRVELATDPTGVVEALGRVLLGTRA